MGNFKKFDKGQPGKSFGGGHFGGGRKFGGPGGGSRPMFPAICSQCGQPCEIPFRPTGDRPVYCRNCFKNQPGGGSSPRFTPKSFGGPAMGPPAGGNVGANQGGGVSKAQFDSLNVKVDRILALLTPAKAVETPPDALVPTKKSKKADGTAKAPAKKSKTKKK